MEVVLALPPVKAKALKHLGMKLLTNVLVFDWQQAYQSLLYNTYLARKIVVNFIINMF